MANEIANFRAELSEKSLSDLRFMLDAGHVGGQPRRAALAAVIREKEEEADAVRLDRQDEINTRSVKAANLSMVATIFAAIATVAVAIIGALQWRTLEESNATVRDSNRAFVYFDRIELRPYPHPPHDVAVYGVTIVLTNSGNTPARRLRFRSECPHVSTDSTTEPFELVKWSRVETKPPMILGPKQTIPLQGCNLGLDQIANLKNGKSKIFVVVEARYEDTFDPNVPRITQTVQRLQFDKDGGHSFGFVGPHNCADQDCPK